MRAPKNFEAIFLAAAVLLNITAFATADETIVARPAAAIQASAGAERATQVVIVKAKRLTAAEKAAM